MGMQKHWKLIQRGDKREGRGGEEVGKRGRRERETYPHWVPGS